MKLMKYFFYFGDDKFLSIFEIFISSSKRDENMMVVLNSDIGGSRSGEMMEKSGENLERN